MTRHSAQVKTKAFTLVELAVVVVMIGILASLLLSALSRTKARAKRLVCVNNLRQVGLAVRMYADTHQDTLPLTNSASIFYVCLVGFPNVNIGTNGLPIVAVPPEWTILLCPTDRFALGTERPWERASWMIPGWWKDMPTYRFNGGNSESADYGGPSSPAGSRPGIAGKRLGAILEPARTVLLAENTAFGGSSSLHDPPKARGEYNNMRNMVGFVDGHVSYIKIYHNNSPEPSCAYDPIPGYDYKWSGQ
jgi:prepilin-type N-terminal cleavage/methylation domain-containing protein/prepilin-type processing-associated H-X9-DG protein